MHDAWKTFIIFLVVAALVGLSIFFVYEKTNESKAVADEQSNKALSVVNKMDEAEFSNYDGGEVSGSEVIGFINTYKNSEEIGVIVKTAAATGINYLREFSSKDWADPATKGYIEKSFTTPADFNKNFIKAKDKTDPEYINPTAKFTPNLIRTTNGPVIGVQFTQK